MPTRPPSPSAPTATPMNERVLDAVIVLCAVTVAGCVIVLVLMAAEVL